jgi:hypothetical protein
MSNDEAQIGTTSFVILISSFEFAGLYIEHDPGAPPHRPQDGASVALVADFPPPDSAPTANTLSARAVFGDPHVGHFGFVSSLIERCNCSNRPPQP